MISKYILEILAERLVIQGPWHTERITEYFTILIQAARNEFTEDNKPTLEYFLKECFDDALERVYNDQQNSP